MRDVPPLIDELDDEVGDERPSKSALKRQMHELQQLGLELSELSANRCAGLELPESLQDALEAFRRTRSFEGRRRQLQFVGKLMRTVDPEPIREAIAASKLGSAKETLALHEAERWRDELLASDDTLTTWVQAHPATPVQTLRNLVRAARKDLSIEAIDQRHGRSYRELFQLVKSQLAARAKSEAEADAQAKAREALDHE
jgi:ribosome-associated protein